jgi:hypothetical protein
MDTRDPDPARVPLPPADSDADLDSDGLHPEPNSDAAHDEGWQGQGASGMAAADPALPATSGATREEGMAGWDSDDDEAADGGALAGARSGDFRGANVSGAVGFGDGPVAAGDITIYQYNRFRRISMPGPFTAEDVARLRAVHLPVAAQAELSRRLREHRVQLLRGRAGSGRRTTAILTLDDLGWPVEILDNVEVFDDEVVVDLELRRRRGYVVDVLGWPVGQPSQSLFASLRKRAEEVDACLILLVDEAVMVHEALRAYFVVEYQPPPGEKLLTAYLRKLVSSDEMASLGPKLKGDLRPLLDQKLGGAYVLADVPRLANQLAVLAKGHTDERELLKTLRSERRTAVQAWLERPTTLEPVAVGDAPQSTLWDRAFVLAAAVLDRFPIDRVVAAADRLAVLIYGVEAPGASPPPRPAFHNRVRSCGDWLTVVETGYIRGLPGQSRTRRVRMRSNVLPEMVLDIAWRDFDALHEPLARWLRELASSQSPLVRERAAFAVSVLAGYDFDHVERTILRRWAASGHAGPQRAAAQALARAPVIDGRVATAVRRTIRDWAGNSRRRHAALLACSSGIKYGLGPSFAYWCVQVVTMAGDLDESHGDEVTTLFTNLLDAGYGDAALRLLGSPAAAVSRAVAFLRTLPNADSRQPSVRLTTLLSAAAMASEQGQPLVRLLATALANPPVIEPPVTRLAWNLVRDLIAVTHEHPNLSRPLAGIMARLGTPGFGDPGLRGRLRHVLHRWLHTDGTMRPAVRAILTEIDQAGTGEVRGQHVSRSA